MTFKLQYQALLWHLPLLDFSTVPTTAYPLPTFVHRLTGDLGGQGTCNLDDQPVVGFGHFVLLGDRLFLQSARFQHLGLVPVSLGLSVQGVNVEALAV